ncbi:hypothetical protein [Polaribacter atrinae]|uniref:hypothetical protein n=1 Tax=Polaribacter atrinae TaxID=1333662 RepID=UPI00249336EF|nr:hypothetical protein [Polaribacter atrinae]
MREIILTITVAIFTSGISSSALAKNNINSNEYVEVMRKDFKEITLKEVPLAVKTAIVKDFIAAFVTKVYVNESKQYKIALTIDDETKFVVFADKEGHWLKDKEIRA